jgi:hypothetical protein
MRPWRSIELEFQDLSGQEMRFFQMTNGFDSVAEVSKNQQTLTERPKVKIICAVKIVNF